jgi:hypothetical protein
MFTPKTQSFEMKSLRISSVVNPSDQLKPLFDSLFEINIAECKLLAAQFQ